MKKIDLVFRTVGERTATVAFELAQKNIQPHEVHIIENVKPFTKAVQQMLEIDYNCDYVVFVDADCLILEDMNPFLQHNTIPLYRLLCFRSVSRLYTLWRTHYPNG